MPAQRESLPAVTIAGVLAIICGIFTIFGSLIFALFLFLIPQMQNTPGITPFPPQMRAIFAVFVIFFLALGAFGIWVGVGVIRRRNWARISILVWGGLMAFFGLATVAFSLVVFNSGLGVDMPSASRVDPRQVMAFTRIFMVLFYGIPAAIGIWWLVLFTRPRVASAFTNAAPSVPPALDASGFPQPALDPLAIRAKTPSCPLPIAVIAGLMGLGSAFMVVFALLPLPSNMPMFFLGHLFTGAGAKAIFLFWGLTSGASAVGIFLLKPWALHTQIGVQALGILNCTVAALSPNYAASMRAAMLRMYGDNSAFSANNPFMTDSYFRSLMVLSSLVVAAILFILVWQRPRFLEAAAAKAASSATSSPLPT